MNARYIGEIIVDFAIINLLIDKLKKVGRVMGVEKWNKFKYPK